MKTYYASNGQQEVNQLMDYARNQGSYQFDIPVKKGEHNYDGAAYMAWGFTNAWAPEINDLIETIVEKNPEIDWCDYEYVSDIHNMPGYEAIIKCFLKED